MLLVRSYRTFAPLPFQISDLTHGLWCKPMAQHLRFWGVPFTGTAVFFCGTILTLTRTGRYPASLVFRKPGLSSDLPWQIRNHLSYFLLRFLFYQFGFVSMAGRGVFRDNLPRGYRDKCDRIRWWMVSMGWVASRRRRGSW